MNAPFRSETLANGLVLEFFDLSNRYFGDYWHLSLEARCRVPVSGSHLPPGEMERALADLGEAVEYVRRLERMGVPTDAVTGARSEMVESFLVSARPYLGGPSFAHRLVSARLREKQRVRRPFPVS